MAPGTSAMRRDGQVVRLPEDEGHPIDRIIREAMAEGKFDNLEGHGKPLAVGPPGDERAPAFRLLKNAGFSPEWVELEGAIERGRADAAATLERYSAAREAAVAEVTSLCEQLACVGSPCPDTGLRRLFGAARRRTRDADRRRLSTRLAGAIEDLNRSRDCALEEHLRRLHGINRLVDRLNLTLPARGRQLWREDVAGAGRDLCERFPRALSPALPTDPRAAPEIEWTPGQAPEKCLRARTEDGDALPRRVRGRVQAEALAEYRHKRARAG